MLVAYLYVNFSLLAKPLRLLLEKVEKKTTKKDLCNKN